MGRHEIPREPLGFGLRLVGAVLALVASIAVMVLFIVTIGALVRRLTG